MSNYRDPEYENPDGSMQMLVFSMLWSAAVVVGFCVWAVWP